MKESESEIDSKPNPTLDQPFLANALPPIDSERRLESLKRSQHGSTPSRSTFSSFIYTFPTCSTSLLYPTASSAITLLGIRLHSTKLAPRIQSLQEFGSTGSKSIRSITKIITLSTNMRFNLPGTSNTPNFKTIHSSLIISKITMSSNLSSKRKIG